MGKIKTTTCGTTKNTTSSSEMKHIFYSPNTTHEWFRFKKAFWSKIAVAGHGKRYLFRLTFSRIIFDLRDNAFPVSVRQTYWKKKTHVTQTIVCRLTVSVLQPTVCSAGFCYCLLLLTPNYQRIQVEWSGAFSKHPKKATLWRELRKKNFPPCGGVRDKNPLWAWAVIFVSSAHGQPDVRNFLTSGNGCLQSLSFPDHVTKNKKQKTKNSPSTHSSANGQILTRTLEQKWLPNDRAIEPVSYTHLTLPTKRIV